MRTGEDMAKPAQTTTRRSAGVVVLAVALLAVLALAGLGAAGNLRAGARAERVRGLAPFTGAATTLVHDLQRERSLAADPSGRQARAAARRSVDQAAANYRDAAVRVDISDRDPRLHRHLDTGLAQLAGLTTLRASGDPPATMFRRYTEIIGGLLTVAGEIGLSEAGQDAGLARSATAANAFSRAKELADRERVGAAQAVADRRLDQAERIRLALLGGRQAALLDQFAAMASPGQMARYARAFSAGEVEQASLLRKTALETTPGRGTTPGLTAWSKAATTRVERMREVEPGLTAELALQATLTDRTADRRTLAYAAAFLLAASTLVVVLVLAPGRSRRPRSEASAVDRPVPGALDPHAPETGAPEREGSPAAEGALVGFHSPPGTPQAGTGSHAEAGPGLADLARRSQDLVDQQLELLDQVARDQGDPKLPGRLLQVDRLAVRARRNAHNLIVLAGGEPSGHWDGPPPLAEVVALAVSDNPDAARIDLDVAGDLLVRGPAAEDLANLLAELVDNATAFSAPETRVRVGGQEVGSGYVLEVEDRGLGMTDGELEAVNRRLTGDPVLGSAGGDDLEQRLGAWVAGRLALRHQVKVQLRRSPYGGVKALVFLPEALVTETEPAGDGTPAADGGDGDPALASVPVRGAPEAEPPLPKRAPHASLAPDLAAGDAGRPGDPARPTARSPEQVRSMLTRYRSGLERGRAAAARDLPEDPDGDPTAP
jgi:hypothetical protein